MLLGAFVLLDICTAANIYGYIITNESTRTNVILLVGLVSMFAAYMCYFRFHDKESLPTTFVNAMSSLVTSLPMLESEFNSVIIFHVPWASNYFSTSRIFRRISWTIQANGGITFDVQGKFRCSQYQLFTMKNLVVQKVAVNISRSTVSIHGFRSDILQA